LHGDGLADFPAWRTPIIDILEAPARRQRSQDKLKLELQRAPPLDSLTGIA
jgi:hypothetical protein